MSNLISTTHLDSDENAPIRNSKKGRQHVKEMYLWAYAAFAPTENSSRWMCKIPSSSIGHKAEIHVSDTSYFNLTRHLSKWHSSVAQSFDALKKECASSESYESVVEAELKKFQASKLRTAFEKGRIAVRDRVEAVMKAKVHFALFLIQQGISFRSLEKLHLDKFFSHLGKSRISILGSRKDFSSTLLPLLHKFTLTKVSMNTLMVNHLFKLFIS